jgi:hypothetical protein
MKYKKEIMELNKSKNQENSPAFRNSIINLETPDISPHRLKRDDEFDGNSNLSNPNNDNYLMERRMGRQFSLYVIPQNDTRFYKLIIPYNFEKKKYFIKEKDIEFYEHKDYLLNKLNSFNSNPVFDIESTYKARGCQNLQIFLPTILVLPILIYISVIILCLFCFNPIVIYTLFSWNKKAVNSLRMFRFISLEKYKMREILVNIKNENLSQNCQDKKIYWTVGESGYWLEIQKIVD